MKMPQLLEHFKEHQEKETPDINLLSFLYLHYADSEHTRSEDHEHKKLPLKDIHISMTVLHSDHLGLFKLEKTYWPEDMNGIKNPFVQNLEAQWIISGIIKPPITA